VAVHRHCVRCHPRPLNEAYNAPARQRGARCGRTCERAGIHLVVMEERRGGGGRTMKKSGVEGSVGGAVWCVGGVVCVWEAGEVRVGGGRWR